MFPSLNRSKVNHNVSEFVLGLNKMRYLPHVAVNITLRCGHDLH